MQGVVCILFGKTNIKFVMVRDMRLIYTCSFQKFSAQWNKCGRLFCFNSILNAISFLAFDSPCVIFIEF